MTPADQRFDAFCRVLVEKSKTTVWYQHALDGFFIREHAQEAHPGELPLVEELGLKRIPDPEHQDAWLFGYRFRDTRAAGGDGDGRAKG